MGHKPQVTTSFSYSHPRTTSKTEKCLFRTFRKTRSCQTCQNEFLANYRKIKSQNAYRSSPRKRRLIREAIEKLYKLDVIQPSKSPIASPVVVIWQKGKPRFCVDLRKVNEQTEADKYALPRQDDIFAALAGAIYFSVMDLNKGYHQLGLDEASRQLTAFITEDAGLWEYLRVPFGLKNAPAFFQRVIDTILGKYRWDFVLAYNLPPSGNCSKLDREYAEQQSLCGKDRREGASCHRQQSQLCGPLCDGSRGAPSP